MNDIKFGNIKELQRVPEIEGETGTEVGLENGTVLTVLAATDANPRWKANQTQIRGELNRLQNARASNSRIRAYLAGIYARCIVIGWTGVVDEGGQEVPFSADACEQFLNAAPDAYDAVDAVIYSTKNFRGAKIEAIVARVGES